MGDVRKLEGTLKECVGGAVDSGLELVLLVGSLLVINSNFYRINNILSKLAELFNQTSSDRNCSSSGRDDLAQHQIG